ncbi:MAG TPA: hypothetical protein VE593_05220 [Nitrososphaeraceae archaeon]|nr:hypothetical protein [Nitrososphaeraceae archaeon]
MKSKDRRNRGSKVLREKKIKRVIVFGLIAVAAIGIGLAVASSKLLAGSNASAQTIDGIQCNAVEQLVFHNHAHLDIFIDGQPYTVPSQVGIVPGKCIYWLHTHDDSGIIHIESPVTRNFTLGQFFDIWKKQFSNVQIFDKTANATNVMAVYLNGNKINREANYRDINIQEHDQIAIVFGRPPSKIPSTYEFPKGL